MSTAETGTPPSRIPSVDTIEAELVGVGKGEAVRRASPALTGKQRRQLRGLGHALKPVVHIGKNGLGASLADALDHALDDHELIKVRLLEGAPAEHQIVAVWIHRALGAQIAQILGHVLLVYRAHPTQPKIRLVGPAEP